MSFEVSLPRPLTVEDIHRNGHITKSRVYLTSVKEPNAFNLFNAIDQDFHRSRRQLVAPVVNDKSMRMFEPTMIEQVDISIQELAPSSQSREPRYIDMTARCKYLGMDIFGLLAFGYHLRLQSEEPNRFIIDTLKASNYLLNLKMQQPLLARLNLDIFLYLRAILRGRSYLSTIEKMTKARMSQDEHAQRDFFSFVTNEIKTSRDGKVWGSAIWAEAIFSLSTGACIMPLISFSLLVES